MHNPKDVCSLWCSFFLTHETGAPSPFSALNYLDYRSIFYISYNLSVNDCWLWHRSRRKMKVCVFQFFEQLSLSSIPTVHYLCCDQWHISVQTTGTVHAGQYHGRNFACTPGKIKGKNTGETIIRFLFIFMTYISI